MAKNQETAVEQVLLNQREVDTENAAFEDEESGLEEISLEQNGGGITDTDAFHIVVGIIIALNTILVVVEASMINNLQVKPYLEKLEFVFTMIYVLEVSLKLKEQGFKRFFCSRGYKWNVFDLVITVVGFADAVVTATGHSGAGASAARLFRVMRLMRLVRAMRFLKDMDTVLKMAGEATLQLGFVVLMVVFISGIVTTNMLWDASDPEVSEKFAYLGRSMWTMYSLMTMDNWTEQVTQIMHTKPGMFVFFILYIFVAAITLMSLTPAIFVQLNMFRREQEAEAKILRKKEQFIQRHATMMDELFKLTDVDHNERISMKEMEKVIKDKPKMNTLKESLVLEEGMLRTVMLSIFDFWDESSFEYHEKSKEFSRREFANHIIERLANPQAELLFCGVATRKMVYDLQQQVHEKLDKIDARLRSIVQAKKGQFSQETLRREDNHAPSRKKKQPGASMLLEASILATDDLRENKQNRGAPHSGSTWDHPFQRKPQLTVSSPFLPQKTSPPEQSPPELSSASSDSELSAPSELVTPRWERPLIDNVQVSQNAASRGTVSTRDTASPQPPENEPKGSVRQLRTVRGDKQEEPPGEANMASATSGWWNFYAGTKGQSQSASIGSFNSTSSTEGRNKVGIQDASREPDSPQNRTRATASGDPLGSACPAPEASTPSAASQNQLQPRMLPRSSSSDMTEYSF